MIDPGLLQAGVEVVQAHADGAGAEGVVGVGVVEDEGAVPVELDPAAGEDVDLVGVPAAKPRRAGQVLARPAPADAPAVGDVERQTVRLAVAQTGADAGSLAHLAPRQACLPRLPAPPVGPGRAGAPRGPHRQIVPALPKRGEEGGMGEAAVGQHHRAHAGRLRPDLRGVPQRRLRPPCHAWIVRAVRGNLRRRGAGRDFSPAAPRVVRLQSSETPVKI